MDVIHVGGTEQVGLIFQPVVQLLGAHGQVPGGVAGIHLFAGVGQLARLVNGQEGVADGAGPAAQVGEIGLSQHFGHCEGDAAHAKAQHGAVRNLSDHVAGNLDVNSSGLLVGAQGQRLMYAFHDIGGFRQMDAVGPVHTVQSGQMLIDLKDHRARMLKNRAPGVVGDAQAAVALRIRPGDGNKGHVHPDVVPVQLRQGTQHHGQKTDQAAALKLALIVADVPAVIGKGGLLGIALHHLDAGTDHQAAADLDIRQLFFSGGKGPVHQLRESCAKAVVDPVAGAHSLGGHLGSDKFIHIIVHGLLLTSVQNGTFADLSPGQAEDGLE